MIYLPIDAIKFSRLSRYRLLLSLLFMVTSLSGCNISVSEQELSGQSLKVSVHDSGIEMKSYKAEAGSPLHQQITQLIILNSDDWTPNFVTYTPGVVVYGKGFNINYLGEQAVYNGSTGQLTRKIERSDYGFLISN
jgi:hypothetical protein